MGVGCDMSLDAPWRVAAELTAVAYGDDELDVAGDADETSEEMHHSCARGCRKHITAQRLLAANQRKRRSHEAEAAGNVALAQLVLHADFGRFFLVKCVVGLQKWVRMC